MTRSCACDEHMRSLQVLDEAAGSGKPRGKRVPR
jgi:hypothetical protein